MLYQIFFISSQKNETKFSRCDFFLVQIMYVDRFRIFVVTKFMLSSVDYIR